jgi:tellurite resistance protein TehA-like permease
MEQSTDFVFKNVSFLTGFVSAPQVICFVLGVAKQTENAKASARATISMFVTLVGVILQPITGLILGYSYNNSAKSTFHSYCANDFKCALSIIPIVTLIGFFVVFLIHHKPNTKSRK